MKQSFTQLAEKYLTDELGPADVELFCQSLQEESNRLLLADMIDSQLQSGELGKSEEHRLRDINFIKIRERLRAGDIIAPVQQAPFIRRAWLRYAAAILLFIAGGVYLWFYTSTNRRSPERVTSEVITPGGNKATLTLSDGSSIILDNAANGNIAKQGSSRIFKQAPALLIYRAGTGAAGETIYNTVTTPRGGQYQLALADGSMIWLNAASSIKFPTAFEGASRRVEITGEAYLEITADTKRPFYVTVNGVEVQVLGTVFNVNTYGDNKIMSVTLIGGSVQVNAFKQSQLLKPGEQAVVSLVDIKDRSQARKVTDLIRVSPVAIDNVLAWKNGFFNFDNVGVEEVMNQLSRWYDVEIVYEKGVPDIRFSGQMARTLSLYDALNSLEMAGFHARIEPGRRVVVSP